MIVLAASAGGRRGRIFARDDLRRAEKSWRTTFAREFLEDPEDAARAERLDAILRQPRVVAVTHRGIDPPDAIHVFLRGPAGVMAEKVFACVVVPESRLDAMLADRGVVFETLTLQVAPALTETALRAAIEAWARRVAGGESSPEIVLDPWQGDRADATSSGIHELLLAMATSDARRRTPHERLGADLTAEVRPAPEIAQPAHEAA